MISHLSKMWEQPEDINLGKENLLPSFFLMVSGTMLWPCFGHAYGLCLL